MAADQYQTNAAARPDDPAALRELAAFHVRTGDRVKAEEAFRKLLAKGSKVPDDLAQWARRGLADGLSLG